MPPKPKVTKEQILQQALALVRERGAGALTAKSLAARLSCSTQPVFWHYAGMDELKADVYRAALGVFGQYLRRPQQGVSAYMAVGLNYIHFAMEERPLFRCLFMGDLGHADVFGAKVEMEYILGVIKQSESITGENAQIIYREMWLFSHGIAAMIASGSAEFSEQELQTMLGHVYRGLSRYLQSENKNS